MFCLNGELYCIKRMCFNMGCFDSGVEDEVKVANQIGIFDTASNK